MNYIEFYRGKYPPFLPPLISYETRGTCCIEEPCAGNSFIPIPFESSLKITVQGLSRFFHIIYERYPHGTPVKTFTGEEEHDALAGCFERAGEVPLKDGGLKWFETALEEIAPGETVQLLKLEKRAGIVRRFEMEADGGVNFFQNARIRMRWDGHHRWDVSAPVGFFFGSAVEADNMNSLPLRVRKLDNGRVQLSCYFPMPFWKEAVIELRLESEEYCGPLDAKIYVSPNPVDRAEGTYLTTLFHQGETVYAHDWLLFEGVGTGWLAGVVQSMQYGHYCEGDERFSIDGTISPQINGTGSEDYYLACFWSNVDFDLPFGCVVGDVKIKGGGHWRGQYIVPSCYSRYHLEAPIPFHASINARIQHGGLSNVKSNYRSLAFCYLNRRPRIRMTDYIDVGNAASEKVHQYRPSRHNRIVDAAYSPEGEYFETSVPGTGRVHQKGEIHFTVAVSPDNQGVRLRRRLDQSTARQKADVFIDDQYAGCWYHGYHNEFLRWFDLDFEVHPRYTTGKSALDVKLVLSEEKGSAGFTDFQYEVYSYFPADGGE